jgi:hypothetical protein
MEEYSHLSTAKALMNEFSILTGLSSTHKLSPRRYLWTDAFAVCNFLGLFQLTHEEDYIHLALNLIDQVHSVLGRHRKDDVRFGWISGLDEKQGMLHPTKGGLRIGKELNERKLDDPFDESLEWDRDGQYYHYLTKWMHALNQVSRVTGDIKYNIWAIELAKAAHEGFTYTPSFDGPKCMYWKMSIDLTYPLISSMGQHDPIDGLITYHQLQAAVVEKSNELKAPDLNAEITDMEMICKGKNWTTGDPLGIGGLLTNAFITGQLIASGYFKRTDLLMTLLDSSSQSLNFYSRENSLEFPAEYRLAFRELGLSIGLHAIERLRSLIKQHPFLFDDLDTLYPQINDLMNYSLLKEQIETFWLKRSNRETRSWKDHGDINMVMLATSLVPDGYLKL